MKGERFLYLIKEAFDPFLKNLGFKIEKPHLSGRYFRARFIGDTHTLVLYFEHGDDYLTGMIMPNNKTDLASIDDPNLVVRLSDLNRMYMSLVPQAARNQNEKYFSSINVHDQDERKLLKFAKDLRLVLPYHLHQHSTDEVP